MAPPTVCTGMGTATLKREFREIKRGRPGRRFKDHYAHKRQAKKRRRSRAGIWRILLGVISVVVGLVLCVIPGPGLPFIFVGGGLLATESLVVARVMDWFELRVRAVARWALGYWKKWPLWVRIIVGALFVSGSIASIYGFYWFMHR